MTLEGVAETSEFGHEIVQRVPHVHGVVAVRDRLSHLAAVFPRTGSTSGQQFVSTSQVGAPDSGGSHDGRSWDGRSALELQVRLVDLGGRPVQRV